MVREGRWTEVPRRAATTHEGHTVSLKGSLYP